MGADAGDGEDLPGAEDDALEIGLGPPDVRARPCGAAPEHSPSAQVDGGRAEIAQFEEAVGLGCRAAGREFVDHDGRPGDEVVGARPQRDI